MLLTDVKLSDILIIVHIVHLIIVQISSGPEWELLSLLSLLNSLEVNFLLGV